MIDNLQAEALKTEYISLLRSTNRNNIENVINWLENKTDFFTAPSSTSRHSSYKHGLLEHSLNVYKLAVEFYNSLKLFKPDINITIDNIKIAALLHDICKSNFYKITTKYRKNDYGTWEEYQGYIIDDVFPYGHGEKSVLFLQMLGLKLEVQEMLAIRWHMGSWDGAMLQNEGKFAYNKACETYPLCSIIQSADNISTMVLEETNK